MKVHIIYDDAGNIRGTLIPSSETSELGIRVPRPLSILLVDREGMPDTEKGRFLAEIHTSHKVQMGQGTPKLVRIKERNLPKGKKKAR